MFLTTLLLYCQVVASGNTSFGLVQPHPSSVQSTNCENCKWPLSPVAGAPCPICGHAKKEALLYTKISDFGIANSFAPTWSNDGSTVVFSKQEIRQADNKPIYLICTIETATGTQTQVTDKAKQWYAFAPVCTDNANEIAYWVNGGDDGRVPEEIEVFSKSTRTTRRLKLGYKASAYIFDWSAEGKFVVFSSSEGGQSNIYLKPNTEASAVRLTHEFGDCKDPRASRNGKLIVFSSIRNGNEDICSITSDGLNPTRLTTHNAIDRIGSWSPDGSQIVFESNRSNSWRLYLMNSDGSNVQPLTPSGENATNASWSPDGSKIAYQSQSNNQISIKILTLKR